MGTEGLTFVKFGGSVITNKRGAESPDLEVIRGLADDLHAARLANPGLSLLVGHGSGSFGHHYAARYGIHRGLTDDGDWMGFALTSGAALRLNRLVADTLLAAGVPALSLQPSASLQSAGGEIVAWETATIRQSLARGLVPVVHGDVTFDTVQGCAIASTEMLFDYLARQPSLHPQRIILVGENAVYTGDPHIEPDAQVIPLISSDNIEQVLHLSRNSHATDVTGGMRSKVETMWSLVQSTPGLVVHLIGATPGLLRRALLGEPLDVGTIIRQ